MKRKRYSFKYIQTMLFGFPRAYDSIKRRGLSLYLTELLVRQKNNKKIAIKHGKNSITYESWHKESYELSELINTNVKNDSRNIAIFLPNSIYYSIAYFAILFSDKVIIPIGTQSKGLEIKSILEYCEIDLIISDLQYKDFLLESLADYNHCISILFIDDGSIEVVNKNKNYITKSGLPQKSGTEDDVAIMLHTSGTTSNPKRVMLTHNNLINNIESNIASLKLTENDITLISMPMYFGYCNTAQFLTHIYLGASMVILDGMFLPKSFFQIVQNEGITSFTGVPSMLLMLLEYRYAGYYNISSLRYICFGGGKMPVEKLKELIIKFNTVGFVQTYGQTEASPRITALLPEDSLKKIGSVGKPIPNVKVKIIDEAGNNVNANEIGEIVIQGKNVMKGYYKQDKITNEIIVDGWLHTGDLGYIDNDGYLYLTGRKKNMIISGGINIYPEEIEEILMQHPNIRDVCVVSEEHAILGEVPIAKVVLKHNLNSTSDLREFCSEKLANHKVPIRFEIVNDLSKTYNGKIKRY